MIMSRQTQAETDAAVMALASTTSTRVATASSDHRCERSENHPDDDPVDRHNHQAARARTKLVIPMIDHACDERSALVGSLRRRRVVDQYRAADLSYRSLWIIHNKICRIS